MIQSGARTARWAALMLIGAATNTVVTAVAAAAPGPVAAAATSASPTSMAGGGLQVLFGLVVVMALLAGAAWMLKRFGPVRGIGGANIKIVGGVSVGNRERVMVVEVADQWIVLGVAPGRVNALATLPRQEGTALTAQPATESAPNFSSWLKRTIDKRNGIQ